MKLSSIVLAGGAGERFGGRKLSAALAGRPLLEFALDAAASAAPDLVVVIGAAPEVADLVHEWSKVGCRPFRIVAADDPSEGMGASLRAGLAALPVDVDGAFVFLGDMPWIPASVIAPLARALAAGAAAAAPVFAGQRGHPVLLGRGLIAQYDRIAGDRGAGELLRSEAGVVLIDVDDDGVLFDVDTPEDLAKRSQ